MAGNSFSFQKWWRLPSFNMKMLNQSERLLMDSENRYSGRTLPTSAPEASGLDFWLAPKADITPLATYK